MRAFTFISLALLGPLGAAGCLSAPTGRDPATIDAAGDAPVDAEDTRWPPGQAAIVAIGAGDLDTDDFDDLVAADQGSARVYVVRGGGGNDLDPTRAGVTTFTDSAPLDGLRAPAAVLVARQSANRFVVVLDNPVAGPRLTVFDAELTLVSQTMLGSMPAPISAAVTLNQTTFGQSGNAVFGSLPESVFFLEGSALGNATPNVMTLPQTGATPFSSVLAVSGFPAGMPNVVVSELDHAQRAVSPSMGVFTWSTVRPTGATWTAQTVADINLDGSGDIVAFKPDDTNPADICVLDSTAGTDACVDTPFGMDTASIAVGAVVSANQSDVILAHVNPGNPSMTALFVVPRLRLTTGTLASDNVSSPGMFAIMDPLLAIAQLDADTTGKEIVVVGKNGAVVCARSNGGAPAACAP